MSSPKKTGAQLVELFQKAVKASEKVEDDEGDQTEETRCVEALKAMKRVPVTTTILMDTQVGKQLRKLTKHKNSRICAIAQELIDAWKKIVAAEAAAKNNGSAAASAAKKAPAAPTAGEDSLKSPGLSSPSPKSPRKVEKVTKLEHQTVQVKTSVTTVTSTTHSHSHSHSQHGNGAAPKPPPVPKCGVPTRDRIRELLAEAFIKVPAEATGESARKAKATDIGHVAASVESAMFKKLGLSTSMANKGKYRSLMFNLKDANNPDLRRRVLLGEILSEELLALTVEDMASDQRKEENQKIKNKALFECERGLKAAASTDQFKCSKCKKRECTYFQMQTRSADEPMTTFVTCVNCNNHWKFC